MCGLSIAIVQQAKSSREISIFAVVKVVDVLQIAVEGIEEFYDDESALR